jgi:hypothetical protein
MNLAITNVGDLLFENKITSDPNDHPINDIVLRIPEYQRPYKWTAKNVNQLLDDIIYAQNNNKEVYRVGTLILHRDSNGDDIVYNIVDGQQRTITFSLMLYALMDLMKEKKEIPFISQGIRDNPYSKFNIGNNFRSLSRRINALKDDSKHIDKVKELFEYVKNNCQLIVIITDDVSEAFQFFDSQNARGKKLYPHDLLKAYHLREMNDLNADETEKIVKIWEDMEQKELSSLFSEYLYRIKEWIKGNRADELNEKNIDIFKGVTRNDNYPYAQFYKGAFAYADNINHSNLPFVTGMHKLSPFQIDTPIVAGKPFFEYSKHYFDILADIRNNDKYEGYYINDHDIIKTLDLPKYKSGVGNKICRLMLDTAILLYVDRFCPEKPIKSDVDMLNQFVVFAFAWAYSLRAQYQNVGWRVAQNFIMGNREKTNSFNIYKTIAEADSPITLLSMLSEKILPLSNLDAKKDDLDDSKKDEVYLNYLYLFKKHNFWSDNNG